MLFLEGLYVFALTKICHNQTAALVLPLKPQNRELLSINYKLLHFFKCSHDLVLCNICFVFQRYLRSSERQTSDYANKTWLCRPTLLTNCFVIWLILCITFVKNNLWPPKFTSLGLLHGSETSTIFHMTDSISLSSVDPKVSKLKSVLLHTQQYSCWQMSVFIF